MKVVKNRYASCAAIRRAKSAIEGAGSIVRVIKVFPDGSMEFVLDGANDDHSTSSEFDRLEAAGLL